MTGTIFTALASILAFALSPAGLISVGNLAGAIGLQLLLAFSLAIVLHSFTAVTYGMAARLFPGPASEARLLGAGVGTLAALALPLVARWPLAVAASVSLLVTAGYAFNEVFARWFPNLGFSFFLLAGLTLINLTNAQIWRFFHGAFAGSAILGLLIMIVFGALTSSNLTTAPSSDASETAVLPLIVFSFFIFFGFDLAAWLAQSERPISRYMIAGLALSALCLISWGMISIRHVDAQRLAQSTLPHMLAAKAILGEPGRLIMGAVVLGGACAAVNVLFHGLTNLTTTLVGGQRRLPTLLLAASIAAMLASGMGGEPVLDTMIAGGFCLWLAHHGALHAALIARCRAARRTGTALADIRLHHAYIALAIIAVVIFGAILYSPDRHAQIKFMAAMLAASVVISFLFLRQRGKFAKSIE